MTLQIHLPEEDVRALAEKAKSRGISTEDYAREVLLNDLGDLPAAEPFWKVFAPVHSLPDEALEGLPTDGASQHDHYLYGNPKRDQ